VMGLVLEKLDLSLDLRMALVMVTCLELGLAPWMA